MLCQLLATWQRRALERDLTKGLVGNLESGKLDIVLAESRYDGTRNIPNLEGTAEVHEA